MAVVIRKKVEFGGAPRELATYQPPGVISKRDRERADRLDAFLKDETQNITDEVLRAEAQEGGPLLRWHLLGQRLREIAGNRGLVASADVENGLLWQAVWQYLPGVLKTEGTIDVETFADRQHRRKDHLTLCYEFAAFEWSEAGWIKRWTDWYEIASRPGLLRDRRVLAELGRAIRGLPIYPTYDQFRAITRQLAEAFPTRKYRDSSLLDDDTIRMNVENALRLALDESSPRR